MRNQSRTNRNHTFLVTCCHGMISTHNITSLIRKMGKLRKKLPKEPKGLKDDALKLTNDVTYDLIAINKAARVEDKSRGLEVGVA